MNVERSEIPHVRIAVRLRIISLIFCRLYSVWRERKIESPALAGQVKSSFDVLLQSHFIEFLARQSKFVQHKSMLGGEHFATMMIFAQGSLADTALWETCEELCYNTGIKIKKQSLH